MAALTRQQILDLKRALQEARSHTLEAEKAYRETGDCAGATRIKALSWQLVAEIEQLDILLAKALPTPVRIA